MVAKLARIKVVVDGFGMGEVILNGIHIGRYVQAVRMTTQIGSGTVVQLDIAADDVEFEGSEAEIVLNQLRPDPEPPAEHDFQLTEQGINRCTICKQVKRRATVLCPGPIST